MGGQVQGHGQVGGCGQTYTDLKKLNVRSVVKMLLSK